MESIHTSFPLNWLTKNQEMVTTPKHLKLSSSRWIAKKNIIPFLLCALCFGVSPTISYSQTVAEREQYYKNIFSKGETTIKSFNSIKRAIHDQVFSDEHDGYTDPSLFQCAFELFCADFLGPITKIEADFNKLNNFRTVPGMDVLKRMNSLQEKKIVLLNEGIRFYEEMSTEINSKPFKRWDVSVIDTFVNTNPNNFQYEMYHRLRPICYEIKLLNSIRTSIASLKCSYVDWHFMVSNNFSKMSQTNPLFNYNMVNHKLAVNPSNLAAAWQMNQLKINIANDPFNYSNITFWDYPDNALYSSWAQPKMVVNLAIGENGQYSAEMANSSNALALVYLVKTLDFKNSTINQLLDNCNLNIPNCSYNQYKFEYWIDELEYGEALQRVNSDQIALYILKEKNKINKLSKIIPNSPSFYVHTDPIKYLEDVSNFDKKSFIVFEIKQRLILAAAYLKSISNDFTFLNTNQKILFDWYNQKMNILNLRAYYQNEYMIQFNKMDPDTWENDLKELTQIIDHLRTIKVAIKDNSANFISAYNSKGTANELSSLFGSKLSADKQILLDTFIITENNNEVNIIKNLIDYQNGQKSTTSLTALGRRCLLNSQYDASEKYFKQALRLSNDNIMITINLAHVYLLKGQLKKARELYLKFPLESISPDLNLSVKMLIISDFKTLEKTGLNTNVFDGIKKELGI